MKLAQSPSLLGFLSRQSRPWLMGATFCLLLVVAVGDYWVGYELSFSVFYLVAISLATWFVGMRFAMLASVVSVSASLIGDLAAGATFSSRLVPIWNACITLLFYGIMVRLLSSLRSLHDNLEVKVRDRTLALTNEMTTRERLERELLAVSEREQRRIGHDLHDSLCQHLTATALAGQVLGEKMAAKHLPEAKDAGHVVSLVVQGIELARGLARGLAPVELEDDGLMSAFHELARSTSEGFKVNCQLDAPDPVLINNPATSMHLFRMAQEAVGNALKHGKAKQITIRFHQTAEGTRLSVQDNGTGLPQPLPEKRGMGLHIMQHRAAMIGGKIEIRRLDQGTIVDCLVPDNEPIAAHELG